MANKHVSLSSGTFQCDGDILPLAGTRLLGQGMFGLTVINLNDAKIYCHDVNNIELGNLKITGTIDDSLAPFVEGAVSIYNDDSATHAKFDFHNIWCTATGGDHFKTYNVGTYTLKEVAYKHIIADSPDQMGFKNDGESGNPHCVDFLYDDCKVINAGVAATRKYMGSGATITEGTGDMAVTSPYTLSPGYNVLTINGAGTFDLAMPAGVNGRAITGGWTVTDSPKLLTQDATTQITVQAGGSGTITILVGESWACAFDFAEFSGLHVEHMKITNCTADGAWESGFHFETVPVKLDVQMSNCLAVDCGQKTVEGNAVPSFGSYSLSGDVTLMNCQDRSSYRSIWAYGNGTTVLANLELHNFRSFDATYDGILVVGLTDPDKLTFIGGGVYNAGHYGIDASGGCPNLRFHDFEVIDPTCANNIANYFSGNNIGLYHCYFKNTGANSGVYLLAGNDIIVTGCRILSGGYAIYAGAGCTRPMATNNNWYGSTTDADLTAATGEIVKGNVDKTGAWVA